MDDVPHPTSSADDDPAGLSDWRLAALGLGPAVVVWLAKVVVWPRAYWHYFFDPESLYVQSGIELLRDHAPRNVDNPGTPIQALSAFALLFTGRSPTAIDAVRHFGYGVALCFAALGCWYLIRSVRRETGDAGAVAVCWLVFAVPQALWRFTIWSPEALFPGFVLLTLGLLWTTLLDPTHRRALALGSVVGLAVATKFTFLVWVPAVVLAVFLRGRLSHEERAAFGLTTLGGTVLGFVVGTLPVAGRYGQMFRFLLDRAGDESVGSALISSATVWFGGVLLLFAVGMLCWLSSLPSRSEERRAARALFGGGVALLVLGIATASNLRYLIAANAGAAAVALAVACMAHRTPRLRVLLLPFVGLLLARQAWIDVSDHRELIRNCDTLAERVAAVVQEEHDGDEEPYVAYGGRMPVPALALLMYTQTPADRAGLEEACGRSGMYDVRRGRVVLPGAPSPDAWDFLVLEQDELDLLAMRHGAVRRVENPLPNAPALFVVSRPE